MYETQRAIFERLNNNANLKNPAAPNRIYEESEASGWDREDGLDYRNYYMVRTGTFSPIGTDHGSAVEYCQKQRIERGAEALAV